MTDWPRLAVRASVSGGLATLISSAALALLARAEGKAAVQPVNATSHWLNGPGAGRVRGVDAAHTGTGLATHAAATVFWAVLFEWWRAEATGPALVRDAVAVSAFAALVDYTVTPKRFTPGWEFVLSKRAMAGAYAAMALGLAAGAALTQRAR